MTFTPLMKYAAVGIAILLLIGAFYAMLNKLTDAAYDKGKADDALAYQKASDKVIQDAAKARGKADTKAAAAAADFAAKQETEKEKIDAAIADGSSPFDVMFNAQ